MSKSNNDAEKEAVLMALDQLSQTMDVMRDILARLKHRLEADGPAHTSVSRARGPGPNSRSAKRKRSEKEAPENPIREKPVVLH